MHVINKTKPISRLRLGGQSALEWHTVTMLVSEQEA